MPPLLQGPGETIDCVFQGRNTLPWRRQGAYSGDPHWGLYSEKRLLRNVGFYRNIAESRRPSLLGARIRRLLVLLCYKVGQPILAAAGFQPALAEYEDSRLRLVRKSRLACGWQPSSLVAISLSASHRLCNQGLPEVGLKADR